MSSIIYFQFFIFIITSYFNFKGIVPTKYSYVAKMTIKQIQITTLILVFWVSV